MRKRKLPIILFMSLIAGLLIVAVVHAGGKPSSYIWVMDWDAPANIGHVVKMCSSGHTLFRVELGLTGRIAVDPRNGTLWATRLYDEGGASVKQVFRIGTDGATLSHYPFSSRISAIDPNDGSLWSVTQGVVLKFSSNGELLEQYDGFEYPEIAINPINNTIWVADNSNTDRGSLGLLDADGIRAFSIETNGVWSLALDPVDGSVWYADLHLNVFNLSADGNRLIKVEGVDRAVFIAVSAKDEAIWVGEVADDNISGALVKLNRQGEIIQKIVLETRPNFVEINPYDNSIWVGMLSKVVRISPDGRILGQTAGFKSPIDISFIPGLPDFLTELRCAFNL